MERVDCGRMNHVAITLRWKEFLISILQAGGTPKKGDRQFFFTPLAFGEESEEFNNDVSKPRKMHYKGKWKVFHAVYRITLGRAQKKGLQFWQTRSHAIILFDSVPADCIEKVVHLQGDKILYQRVCTPRLAPKMYSKMPGS